MIKNKFLKRLLAKEDPTVYQLKDASLEPSLTTLDLIGLGDGDGRRHGDLYLARNRSC